MPMFHEPFLQLSQLRPHLTPLLFKTPSDHTLLLCVLPMGRTSRCKPRQAILCLGSCRYQPPCREQRPLCLYAGLWQGVPFRVLAPHRWQGQSGPKRHGIPFSRLLFVMLKSLPHMGFIITHYWWRCEGWVV